MEDTNTRKVYGIVEWEHGTISLRIVDVAPLGSGMIGDRLTTGAEKIQDRLNQDGTGGKVVAVSAGHGNVWQAVTPATGLEVSRPRKKRIRINIEGK